MKKLLLGMILILFFNFEPFSQKAQSFSLDNKKINYHIFKTPLQFLDSNKVRISEVYLHVISRSSYRDKMKLIKYEDWMRLLKNENTDWAANIWLYDINKKDATLFQIYKNRMSWVKCCKEHDLAYWAENLTH